MKTQNKKVVLVLNLKEKLGAGDKTWKTFDNLNIKIIFNIVMYPEKNVSSIIIALFAVSCN